MGAESLEWLWGREELSMTENAKIPGRNAGLICRAAGRFYWQMRRVRWRFPGVAVLVILMWDVA